MEEVEVTEVPFQRPDDFDLEKHLAGSFGVYHGTGDVSVEVRFTPAVARYVEEARWHESQDWRGSADGSLVAKFRLSDTTEIKRWIMSFGKHAQVIEPAELCNELATELSKFVGGLPRPNPVVFRTCSTNYGTSFAKRGKR